MRQRRRMAPLAAATVATVQAPMASSAAPTAPLPARLVSKMTGADSLSATDTHWQIDGQVDDFSIVTSP